MPQHYYVLDKPNVQAPSFLYFIYQCSNGRLKYSLGIKLSPKEWGNRKQKKPSDQLRNANILIARIDQKMQQIYLKKSVEGKPIFKLELKNELDILLGKLKIAKVETDFFGMYQQIIDDRQNGQELHKGKRFSPDTCKGYRRTKQALIDYQKDVGYLLDMQTFSIHDYTAIYAYLTHNLNLALNSVGSILKTLKAFIKAGYDRGWHTNTIFLDAKFKIPAEDTVDIYLSITELEILSAMELSGTQKISRDWLIVEAFTGLRVSDALRLKQVNIGTNKIQISNEKTDETVILPMHRLLVQVLTANGNNWPPFLAAQTINEKIKQVGKMAGFNSTVLYTVTKAGKRVDEYLPKYQLMSNHTGRRSFITNLLRNNANESMVMKLVGIKKAATLQRYNKMSSSEVADMASEMPFFK
jgi:site-specific recombinase XerD